MKALRKNIGTRLLLSALGTRYARNRSLTVLIFSVVSFGRHTRAWFRRGRHRTQRMLHAILQCSGQYVGTSLSGLSAMLVLQPSHRPVPLAMHPCPVRCPLYPQPATNNATSTTGAASCRFCSAINVNNAPVITTRLRSGRFVSYYSTFTEPVRAGAPADRAPAQPASRLLSRHAAARHIS